MKHATMKHAAKKHAEAHLVARWKKALGVAVLAVSVFGYAAQARAVDLPTAAASPLTGVAFDDRPLILPVQRNFQMAMLTAGSELGRSCGKMEAYGWRMSQSEQGRVNQIFNNTADKLRLMGFAITPQTLTSVSKDITLYTADRANKHYLFLWSAGELGLVLSLCETTAPTAPARRSTALTATPSVEVFPVPVAQAPLARSQGKAGGKAPASGGFTPVGQWLGAYTCAQGLTGASLQIDRLRGENFDGVFRFYPTEKNPSVPSGSYAISGQYDKESKRILINPGKWINRPQGFYNTVIVGAFDPTKDSFSAYFQGVSGCTSFEARRDGVSGVLAELKAKKPKAAKPATKKKAAKKKKVEKAVTPITVESLTAPESGGISVGAPAK